MRVLPSRLEPPPAGVPSRRLGWPRRLAELVRYEQRAGGECLRQRAFSKSYTHVLNLAVAGDNSPADLFFYLTSAMDEAGTGNCG